MLGFIFRAKAVIAAFLLSSFSATGAAALEVDYFQLIKAAVNADPLLQSQAKQAQAYGQQAMASEQWQDPQINLSMVNLPVNGFDFNQEAMSQMKVGISQRLPQGETLAIKAEQNRLKADLVGLQASHRRIELQRDVGNHWLKLHFARASKRYMLQSRELFSKLSEVTQSQYAAGDKRLQDVVRAELEQTRLDLRISQTEGDIAVLQAGFNRWLSDEQLAQLAGQPHGGDKLPALNINPAVLTWSPTELKQQLLLHPRLQMAQQHITLSDKNTELVKQRYQPDYTLNASYGLRADDLAGRSRADFFSVGVKFSMPLFSSVKQDRQVDAAILDSGAKTLNKALLLQQMHGAFSRHKADLARLQKVFALYNNALLKQLHEQSQTTLSAYNSDQGDFSEVMRAYIDELNGQIAYAELKVQLLKQANNINYLLVQPTVGVSGGLSYE